jgi:hypothetical protein
MQVSGVPAKGLKEAGSPRYIEYMEQRICNTLKFYQNQCIQTLWRISVN